MSAAMKAVHLDIEQAAVAAKDAGMTTAEAIGVFLNAWREAEAIDIHHHRYPEA